MPNAARRPSIPAPIPLHTEIALARDDVTYTGTFSHLGRKVRIRIRSNAYDFQCSAIVETLDETKLAWNPLASIHHSRMKTPDKLCYSPLATGDPAIAETRLLPLFRDDIDALLSQFTDLAS